MSTSFSNNRIPKEGSQCICLSVILMDSVYNKKKNYYPQAFLEECKYVVKEKEFITDDISSDDSDKEDSDEQCSDEETSNEEKILMKKVKYINIFRKM